MPTTPTRFPNGLLVEENIQCNGEILPRRTKVRLLAQEDLAVFAIPLTDFRTWDSQAVNLPATAGTDDLGLITGTHGTASLMIQTGDLKNAGATTRYAGLQFQLPVNYVAGETINLRIKAGMITTVASAAATIDVEAYRVDRDGAVGADICATAAQSINSLTAANKDFVITAASLAPGDMLYIRIAILVNDSGTGTAVIGAAKAVEMLLDICG